MKVLGLDIGSASIGWSVVDFNDDASDVKLCGMGVRIIPYPSDNVANEFNVGKGDTPCSVRTTARGMRRNLDRWQLHREQLKEVLISLGIMKKGEEFVPLSPIQQWGLRADAASPEIAISLNDLARVLLHINHRRGYKHAKSDMAGGKETEYVAKVNNRFKEITELGLTVGEYCFKKLQESEHVGPTGKKDYSYRIKEQVYPRQAYEQEVRTILNAQKLHYPEILTDEAIEKIFKVIFYQRPLKSCKHLVSYCDFERKVFKNSKGKSVDSGPKVTPRTSPLAQLCRVYEVVNNIRLINPRISKDRKVYAPSLFDEPVTLPSQMRKFMHEFKINDEEREKIVAHLNTSEKLTEKKLFEILGLKNADGFKGDKLLAKGIKGNDTYVSIKKAISNLPEEQQNALLKFDVKIEEGSDGKKVIDCDYQREPLYMLWHTLYSIDDREELKLVLSKKFGITDEATLENLFAIDFVKAGYSNKSAKFIRHILPGLMEGKMYSEACDEAGYNHSNSITKEENAERELVSEISPIQNGSLRQPVVEKVVNQTINLVNAIRKQFGDIDDVRIELARELKQSKADRYETTAAINKQERENKSYEEQIAELGIRATRRRIQKMRMWKETDGFCIYCGTQISPTQFVEGHGYDIEHIIPRSRLFDDSFANKTCACRECNAAKGNKTAYEFMKVKPENEFNSYKDRVYEMWKGGKISKRKRDYLLMDGDSIPDDFINRDLRETQYITRKVMEVLRQGFRNVYASSGSVTDFFRHIWGYDMILHDLNFPKYANVGLVEEITYETHGQVHTDVRIPGWTKRNDHRHHAIDALVVALTRQGYIQRLNTLNTLHNQSDVYEAGKKNLERWGVAQPHIGIEDVKGMTEKISVSFKGGKKLATPGKRYKDKDGTERRTLVPRAPLHKESVYGEILVHDGKKKLKYAFEHPELIADKQIRQLVEERLAAHKNESKLALASLKKKPLEVRGKVIEEVVCFKKEIVLKYKISEIDKKDIDSIIDSRIRELVFDRYKSCKNKLEFQKSLNEEPLYSDRAKTKVIKTVRCFTGLKPETLAAVAHDSNGKPIGFSQTRNNHHMAIYRLPDGKLTHTIASFWECIKRKRYNVPIIIEEPASAWDCLLNQEDSSDIVEIAQGLPPADSEFVLSLQRNEMVVLGMSDDEWRDAVATNDLAEINRHLYRVWKLSAGDYNFKFHTNTEATVKNGDSEIRAHYRVASLSGLFALHPRKIRLDVLGNLILE